MAEDRNKYDPFGNGGANTWRPSSGVAEDRNFYFDVIRGEHKT